MARPVASIIIPVRNGEAFLGAAVRSALEQTEHAVEVIIVDDASTDGTPRICAEFRARDHRVQVLRLNSQGGAATARNRGIAAATSRWIVPLDADDSMDARRIARLIQLAEKSGADLLADNLTLCEFDTGRPVGQLVGTPSQGLPEVSAYDLLHSELAGQSRVSLTSFGYLKPIARKSFLEQHALRYPEDVWPDEDFFFYLLCLLKGAKFRLTSESYYRYTLRAGSVSRTAGVEGSRTQIATTERFISELGGRVEPNLLRLLEVRAHNLELQLHFERFAHALRTGQYRQVLKLMPTRPSLTRYTVRRLRLALARRLYRRALVAVAWLTLPELVSEMVASLVRG